MYNGLVGYYYEGINTRSADFIKVIYGGCYYCFVLGIHSMIDRILKSDGGNVVNENEDLFQFKRVKRKSFLLVY